MVFRLTLLVCLSALVSCAPRHEILGTEYGFSGNTTQILLDASIDKLRIRHVRRTEKKCVSGYHEHLEIEGEIGPESTEVIARLLPKLATCKKSIGGRFANSVYLSSGGGYLSDGYKLGNLFKRYEIETIVTGSQICASSCAIAFLGGTHRTLQHDAQLLFHAPYTKRGIGIDCSDRGQVEDLRKYYVNTLGQKDGSFLLDRTLSYCSSSTGWSINADGAKLFGITTY
jgi:hypothetical protein